MTIGLAALTAWGSGQFQGLVTGLQFPFALPGESSEQTQQRIAEFEARLTDVGLGLFNDFFLVAMGLCLIAIVPAAVMAWDHRRKTPDS